MTFAWFGQNKLYLEKKFLSGVSLQSTMVLFVLICCIFYLYPFIASSYSLGIALRHSINVLAIVQPQC